MVLQFRFRKLYYVLTVLCLLMLLLTVAQRLVLFRNRNGANVIATKQLTLTHDHGIALDAAAAARFSARRARMKEECNEKKTYPLRTIWKSRLNFLLDYPSRLLVCAVPKSGSSAWHAVIWAIGRHRKGLSQDSVLYTHNDTRLVKSMVSRINQDEGANLIRRVKGDDDFSKPSPPNSSFRVILARHPFARLISGWNQKFSLQKTYWVFLFKKFKEMLLFRTNPSETHVLTFNDFVTFLTQKYGNGKYFDSHFHPATTLCRICEYDYTYVVKAESLEADEHWFMNRMNLGEINTHRRSIGPQGGVNHTDVKESIRKYMSMLNPTVVKKLYKLYEADFNYFGYTFNFTTLEGGGFE